MQTTTETAPGTTHQWHAAQENPHDPPGGEAYRQVSGRAVASFVIPITALPLAWIPFANILALAIAITSLIMGIKAFHECNRNPKLGGTGLAIAGITISTIALIAALGFIIFFGFMMMIGEW